MSLHLDVTTTGRSCTVAATGVLDGATAPRLVDLAGAECLAAARFVTIDLAGVTLVDVRGWHALRQLAADLSDRGTTVTQIGARPAYDRLDAVLVGLDTCRRRPGRPACSAA
jgi:anti-anti-sigma regulatory factor